MNKNAVDFPAGYSYLATIFWFLGGAVITALFSGSLAVLAHDIDPVEFSIAEVEMLEININGNAIGPAYLVRDND